MDLAVHVDSQQIHSRKWSEKRRTWKNGVETCTKCCEHDSDDAVELVFGKETVTHLEGVASAPCLIDLRLDHWVLVRKLEIIDNL